MKLKKLLCMLLSLLIIVGAVPFCAYALDKETVATGSSVYYIETYEQLQAHALHAQADCRYILDDNIIQEDNSNNNEIIIPAGAVFNLDLNGYNIQRVTQGNDCALFRIKSDGRMTINDTSESKTGGCLFSEGYADYSKAVFYNDGGELEIYDGYYEIVSPYEQGDCSIVRATSGYTNIYDGTFDSSCSWGGNTISVGHNAYVYEVPQVVIFGGDFYGKYMNIDVTPFDNYLNYDCLFPSVYVLGGNFYVTNGGKDGDDASFAYCNNGWGRVIVAEGTVLYKCLNSRDQRFLEGVSKKYFTDTIDDYTGGYYKVTAPPMIMSDSLDYYYRLVNLCKKAEVKSYGESVYESHKEQFDEVLSVIDTIMVWETDKASPEIKLENRTADHQYVNWYICEESAYNGKDTLWTPLGDIQNVTQWTPEERPEDAASYIIRAVVTKSDLTTYEDMVRLSYAPLKKAETVDSVEINGIKTPEAGDTPDFDLTPADDSFYINGVFWTDITDSKNKFVLKETDVFEAGHEYELQVWIRANEYYKFKLDSDDLINISATVDGKEAEVILPGSAISAELMLIYTVDEEVSTPEASADPTESSTSAQATAPAETSKPADSTEPTQTKSTDPEESSTSGETESTEPSTSATSEGTAPTESTIPSENTNATKPSDSVTAPSENTVTNPTALEGDKGILGDVNGDGKVNVKDATLIQKFAAKLIDLTDAEKLRADVNGDGKVNVKDATAIQKYAAKIQTGFPIGEKII